jgi:Na+-transporting NADH:ubiquinone oxidoreductase subunit C
MKNESTGKILGISLGVCLICAILVSTTAVTLKPIQRQNQENDRLRNILNVAGLLTGGTTDYQSLYQSRIRPVVIDLKTGYPIPEADCPDEFKPDRFDIKALAGQTEYTVPLEHDPAQIKRQPILMIMYKVMESDSVTAIILPMYGKGLWSTMYAFIALDADLKTIRAFTVYEHGETPGLGGEVDNPRWKRLWVGKEAFDADGDLKIEVIKGTVDLTDPASSHQIDGLSGSTLTTRGVNNMVRFWLGDVWKTCLDRLKHNKK